MNWIDREEMLEKLVGCTQCICTFIVLILLVPALLIFGWFAVSGPFN